MICASALAVIIGLVDAIAVGRLDEQDFRRGNGRRVGQHGTVVAAEIAAEEHLAGDRLRDASRARMPIRADGRRS